jgi:hypothetical protein
MYSISRHTCPSKPSTGPCRVGCALQRMVDDETVKHRNSTRARPLDHVPPQPAPQHENLGNIARAYMCIRPLLDQRSSHSLQSYQANCTHPEDVTVGNPCSSSRSPRSTTTRLHTAASCPYPTGNTPSSLQLRKVNVLPVATDNRPRHIPRTAASLKQLRFQAAKHALFSAHTKVLSHQGGRAQTPALQQPGEHAPSRSA